MGSIASAVGGVVSGIGGMISGNKAADAANQQAEYLRNLSAEQRKAITDAAASAASRGQFKPVTVTSSFGTPQYTYDSTGRLTGVSTTPADWLAQLQQRQTGLLPQYMGLTESALSSAPEYAAAAGQARQAGTDVYGMAGQAAGQAQGLYDVGQEMYNLSRGLQPQVQGMYATGQELAGMGRQAAGQAQGLFGQAQGLYGQAQGLYDVGQGLYGQGQNLYNVAQGMYGTGATIDQLAQQAAAKEAGFAGTGTELTGTGADIYQKAAQALPESYDTAQATQDYYKRMQQLVAPEREKQLAKTRQGLFNTGRAGLAIGATQEGGQLATNPEMAAYYNAIAQQDLQLANQAEQQALSNLAQRTNIGQGLYQSGLSQYQAGLGAQAQGLGALQTGSGMYGQGVAARQAGVGTTQAGAGIIGQGVGATQAGMGATQAGIGATQAGLGAMTTGGNLIGQGLGATQAGISGVGQMANILGQGVGATQAGTGQLSSAANMYGQGTGLFSNAGSLQGQLYANIAASQAPFAAGMQATTGLEQTAYSPVTQGMQYAGLVVPAEQWAGTMGFQGATAAANTAAQYAPQIANYQFQNSSYSPWGSLLSGAGQGIQTYGAQSQQADLMKQLAQIKWG